MTLRIFRVWSALVIGLFSLSMHAETLVVNGDEAYPPVVYLTEGKAAGILPAILKRAEPLTGDTYQVQLAPWKRAYETALRGEGGVIGVSFTAERAKLFDFSKPIYDDDIQIVVIKGREFPYAKVDDLKGKVVGGVIGASYGEPVDKAIEAKLFTVERDIGQVNRLRKLLAGRLDAAFIGNGHAGFDAIVNSHEELRANRDKFVILPVPLARDPLHLAFSKAQNKVEALARFDAAVEKLRKSGELKKIANEGSRTPP